MISQSLSVIPSSVINILSSFGRLGLSGTLAHRGSRSDNRYSCRRRRESAKSPLPNVTCDPVKLLEHSIRFCQGTWSTSCTVYSAQCPAVNYTVLFKCVERRATSDVHTDTGMHIDKHLLPRLLFCGNVHRVHKHLRFTHQGVRFRLLEALLDVSYSVQVYLHFFFFSKPILVYMYMCFKKLEVILHSLSHLFLHCLFFQQGYSFFRRCPSLESDANVMQKKNILFPLISFHLVLSSPVY